MVWLQTIWGHFGCDFFVNTACVSPAANHTASLLENDYSTSKTVSELTFSNGQTDKTISIQVLDDQVPEIDEYFTITLVNPQGGVAIFNQSKVPQIENLNSGKS